jgi:rSAM/selenodomain-associated transferase 2
MSGQEHIKNIDSVSVVIPTLNAAATLPATLRALGPMTEVIVVDGGSADGTAEIAERLGARVLAAPRGRGTQLAAGIAASHGQWLLLLHADTRLAPDWREAAAHHLGTARAGYFRLAFDSPDPRARRLERLVAWRCRVLALPYGDQGLLLPRALLAAVGGMRPLPLMEDVDLVRRLGRGRLAVIDAAAVTSAIRYQRDGWLLRPLRNLCCLGLWAIGVRADVINRLYR